MTQSTVQTIDSAWAEGQAASQADAFVESNPHPPQSREWHAWIAAWHHDKAWAGMVKQW